MRVLAILAAIPLLALAVLILAWAQTPIAESLAAPVGAGFGDAERAVGAGCGLALVLLAGGVAVGGVLALPVLLAQRAERRAILRGVARPLPPVRRPLPAGTMIDVDYWEEQREEQYGEQ